MIVLDFVIRNVMASVRIGQGNSSIHRPKESQNTKLCRQKPNPFGLLILLLLQKKQPRKGDGNPRLLCKHSFGAAGRETLVVKQATHKPKISAGMIFSFLVLRAYVVESLHARYQYFRRQLSQKLQENQFNPR